MNILDIAVIAVIGFFSIISWKKGFIKSCLSFLPMAASLFFTYKIYPFLSVAVRSTALYDSLKKLVADRLYLNEIITQGAGQSQAELINTMSLPEFIKSALIENNNKVVYDVLKVSGLGDYISGYIASVLLNILCLILTFLLLLLIMKLLLAALNLFAHLPVISLVNQFFGLLVGIIQGVGVVWLLDLALIFYYCSKPLSPVFDLLNQSLIAGKLYDSNLLLFMILKIFT
ncbi:MAG: hypothetical protein KHZ62_07370 [Clostridiales bacterium]|nr:hypothetical protein [Clostridiales bacterium]